ncbi:MULTISPECIES: hypothetical protein [unclassified Arthrobacter]|uniref:hypothetical protein n=1 Tax=unclassified Arthrobacter TaxID=235627 RepID=UPI001F0D3395|nr:MULTISPECIES: hypothetical protein [unclassified Arthrobacter]
MKASELISLYNAGGTTIDLCNLTDGLKSKGLLVEQEQSHQPSRRRHGPAAALLCC